MNSFASTLAWAVLIGVGALVVPIALLMVLYVPLLGVALGIGAVASMLVGTMRLLAAR